MHLLMLRFHYSSVGWFRKHMIGIYMLKDVELHNNEFMFDLHIVVNCLFDKTLKYGVELSTF